MSAKESPATVGDSGLARLNGHSRQIPLNVLRELFDSPIPAFGLLSQRLQHDGIEIAAQPALQFRWQEAALVAHRLRCNDT
ncbi:MAG: hypothetical protein WBV41_21445, partial [Terriglobales bacterium]